MSKFRPEAGKNASLRATSSKSSISMHGDSSMESKADSRGIDRPSVKINSSFSVNRVVRVFGTFNGEKAELVKEIGFGGLMHLRKQDRFDRQFALWLLSSMDHTNGSFRMKDGSILEITDFDVHLVLGLPFGGDPVYVSSKCARRELDKIKAILMIPQSSDVCVDYLEDLLVRAYCTPMSVRDRNAFKVAAVLFADAYFLRPHGTAVKVNQGIFGNLVDIASICNKDWSSYVLRGLKRACCRLQHGLRHENKSIILDGCLIMLQVFYLDNLEAGDMKTAQQLFPRISDFDYNRMKRMIAFDREGSTKGLVEGFGNCKLRAPSEVVYSRGKNLQDITLRDWNSPDENSEAQNLCLMEIKRELDEIKNDFSSKLDRLYRKIEYSLCEESHRGSMNSTNDPDIGDCGLHVSCSPKSPYCFIRRRVNHSTKRTNKFMFIESPSSGGSNCRGEDFCEVNCIISEVPKGNMATEDSTTRAITIDVPIIDLTSEISPTCLSVDTKLQNVKCNEQVPYCADEIGTEGLTDRALGSNKVHCSPPVSVNDLLVEGSASSVRWDSTPLVTTKNMERSFPCSPFDMDVFHQPAPYKGIHELMKLLPCMDEEDIQRSWFIHDYPSRINISGVVMHPQFTCESDISVDVMDAIVRMYKQEEDALYEKISEKRWRHLIEASWSVACLNSGIDTSSELIAAKFQAPYVQYNISECRLVLAPVYSGDVWSCYVWDFQKNTIVVIDPVGMLCDVDFLEEKHAGNIKVLHDALFRCLEAFTSFVSDPSDTWDHEYLKVEGARSARCNSGFYTASYLVEFNGMTLNDTLSFDKLPFYRNNILFKLLTMKGNIGHRPCVLERALSDFF
ncbi:hypothetical protein ACP70R_022795 [Stipagrostis hirtigluma subsp. patula]